MKWCKIMWTHPMGVRLINNLLEKKKLEKHFLSIQPNSNILSYVWNKEWNQFDLYKNFVIFFVFVLEPSFWIERMKKKVEIFFVIFIPQSPSRVGITTPTHFIQLNINVFFFRFHEFNSRFRYWMKIIMIRPF